MARTRSAALYVRYCRYSSKTDHLKSKGSLLEKGDEEYMEAEVKSSEILHAADLFAMGSGTPHGRKSIAIANHRNHKRVVIRVTVTIDYKRL